MPGTGAAPQDPTRQTDVCVIDRIQRRTVELRAVASGIPGQADGGQAAEAIAPAPVPAVSAVPSRTDASADSIYPYGPASPPERRAAGRCASASWMAGPSSTTLTTAPTNRRSFASSRSG